MSEPKIIETSMHKAREWLAEMAGELGTDDRHYAYRALRAYLHAVRDRISVEEAAQLGAQMPLLIRGIYYDGWVPARTPASYHTVDEFLTRVAEEAQLAGETEVRNEDVVSRSVTVLRPPFTAKRPCIATD